MSTELIFSVEESPEGGYQAKALGESIFTEAETIEELKINVKEAVLTHFEEGKHPRIIRLHYTKEELINV
jgi:predicted RNase H-like HicB family nuclease